MYNFNKSQKRDILKQANINLKKLHPTEKPITLNYIESKYKLNPLSIEADSKTTKGSKNGYLTGILYLASASLSGVNLCPAASTGCIESCLLYAGRGRMKNVTKARIGKTLALLFDPPRYLKSIQRGIDSLKVKAKNKNMTPIIRLNGTSDIMWNNKTDLISDNSEIQFYDYTKNNSAFKNIPKNYHLTFSMHETNEKAALKLLSQGHNVAVVFFELPPFYRGYQVINGDKTDLRFLDKKGGYIIGLKAKGPAKKDNTNFVKRAA